MNDTKSLSTAEIANDGNPFWGVRWRCDGSGCHPEVGFEVPKSLTRSPRRLRLCGSGSETKCGGRDRDVRRALESQTTGLALAGEILADARRTLDDACRATHACSSRARALAASIRPRPWKVTAWLSTPAGLHLEAKAGGQKEGLDCSVGESGDVDCKLRVDDPAGVGTFEYVPANGLSGGDTWIRVAPEGELVMRVERRDGDESWLPGCSIEGALLLARGHGLSTSDDK